MKTLNDFTVAKTIRDQIGHKALFMLGAYNFSTDDGNNFSFRIKGSRRVNFVKIAYDQIWDLYNVTFGQIRDYRYKTVSYFEGVYCDQLCEMIEKETGLYTHL